MLTSAFKRWSQIFSAGLLRLWDRVRGNADSVRRIETQYALKNTMGYGLNAFLDHSSRPRSWRI